MTLQEPLLPLSPSLADCKKYMRDLVQWIGPGFHPDSVFEDYVTPSLEHCFSSADAERLNALLEKAMTVLANAGIDPCEIALPVQRKLLRQAGCR
jgi:hypothetical protein